MNKIFNLINLLQLTSSDYLKEIKKKIKIIRSYFLRILKNMPPYCFYLNTKAQEEKIIHVRKKNSEIFFGYYDISPFNNSGTKVLCHVYDNKNKNEIYLGYVNISPDSKKKINIFSKTSAWCWQMGSRLQWFPSKNNNFVIFNVVKKNSYGSKVLDIKSGETIKDYDHPIYAFNYTNRNVLNLNFDRLQRLRPGYGYKNFIDKSKNEILPEDDGLYLFNLNTEKNTLLYSLKEISMTDFAQEYGMAEHYINHISWSPGGDKYAFFHLWQKKGIRQSRLMVGGTNLNLRCLYTPFDGNISHSTWKNDNEILVTVSEMNTIKYILINIMNQKIKIFDEKVLNQDGHPSFLPNDDNIILIDTYPDKYRNQHLYTYNILDNNKTRIASFYSPPNYSGEFRCDLHPRLSNDGSKVCLDSTSFGQRQLVIIPLNDKP